MKIIAVSGTPCTGKTTLAKKIAAKFNYKYLDVNKFIEQSGLPQEYDKKRKCKIIDIKKLNKALIKEIKAFEKLNDLFFIGDKKNFKKIKFLRYDGMVIDSHLSHYLPKKYVDLCVITKCNLKKLKKRLEKRSYSKSKVRENLDAEIFDVCLNEAKENKHNVLIVDTSKKIDFSFQNFHFINNSV